MLSLIVFMWRYCREKQHILPTFFAAVLDVIAINRIVDSDVMNYVDRAVMLVVAVIIMLKIQFRRYCGIFFYSKLLVIITAFAGYHVSCVYASGTALSGIRNHLGCIVITTI